MSTGINDIGSRLHSNLCSYFGSRQGFSDWLGKFELIGSMPGTLNEVGRSVLNHAHGAALVGGHIVSAQEAMIELESNGVNWESEIRSAFNKARSEWPDVANAHQVVSEQIGKVLG